MFRLFKKNAGFAIDDAPLEPANSELTTPASRPAMDYHRFHGFQRAPFDLTPDPSLFIPDPSHQEALTKLTHGLHSDRGLIVLTGEVGTGKTLLLHTLIHSLDADFRVAYLFNARLTPDELLAMILGEFNVATLAKNKVDRLRALHEHLKDTRRRGLRPVLIVDDAQNLHEATLEEIRLLSNMETPAGKLLQFVITGQPELTELLNRPSLRQLKQRIAVRHNLTALSPSEAEHYIKKRCELAGRSAPLFCRNTILRIYVASGGYPRLINTICDALLFQLFMRKRQFPEISDLKKVLDDLDIKPVRALDK